jgi:hypothetical protein
LRDEDYPASSSDAAGYPVVAGALLVLQRIYISWYGFL